MAWLERENEIGKQLRKAYCKSVLFPLEDQGGKHLNVVGLYIDDRKEQAVALCSKYGKGGELRHPTPFAKRHEKSHTRQKCSNIPKEYHREKTLLGKS